MPKKTNTTKPVKQWPKFEELRNALIKLDVALKQVSAFDDELITGDFTGWEHDEGFFDISEPRSLVSNSSRALHPGSFSDRLNKLAVGGFFFVPEPAEGRLATIHLAVRRFTKTDEDAREFSIKVCVGWAFDMSETPFKFVRITRTV